MVDHWLISRKPLVIFVTIPTTSAISHSLCDVADQVVFMATSKTLSNPVEDDPKLNHTHYNKKGQSLMSTQEMF
jgi:hypothetical protein